MDNSKVDQGTAFGTWADPVSRFMYHEFLDSLVRNDIIKFEGTVGDFGGANGLLKKYIPDHHVTTIDIDASKKPDVVADILQHDDYYGTAFTRYVMHYLTDLEVIRFVNLVNAGKLLMIEFTNEDLRTKYVNSVEEVKYFRTRSQLEALLGGGAKLLHSESYTVDAQFYHNRLGTPHGVPHEETVNLYEVSL